MPQKIDSELVRLARAGDKKAFGDLITRHLPMARRLAQDMVGSAEIAKELAQEAMLQAYLSLGHLREDGHFRSWLGGIVLNVCRSHLREQRREEPLWGDLFLLAAPDPHRLVEEKEQQRLIREAISALSPENQAALQRFYYEQWSLREIAADLGISVVAVKGRLHKGRRQLRERLLPLYPQYEAVLPRRHRRKRMVKVTVIGVYMYQEEGKVASHFVLLADDGDRRLRIWVGQFEAWAISYGLEKAATERPMTMDLMANLLRETGTVLEEVQISALKNETFYATLKLTVGSQQREMDARPSDAIALALHTGSPILVSQEILEQAERDVSIGTQLTELVSQKKHSVQMAPAATDDDTLRNIAETILHQAIHEGAQYVTFGTGPNQPSFHVLYGVGEECIDAMVLPLPTLQPLTECFRQMTALPGAPNHILVEHDGKIFDAHIIYSMGGYTIGFISLKELPESAAIVPLEVLPGK
jgi:RNA polymerase sigma factor (sigma-70 family)